MGKPYSMYLRERAVAAVLKGGLSCHKAAAQFGLGVNTVILWVRRMRHEPENNVVEEIFRSKRKR